MKIKTFLIAILSILLLSIINSPLSHASNPRNHSEREAWAWRNAPRPNSCPTLCGAMWLINADTRQDNYAELYNNDNAIHANRGNNIEHHPGGRKILKMKAIGTVLGLDGTSPTTIYAKITSLSAHRNGKGLNIWHSGNGVIPREVGVGPTFGNAYVDRYAMIYVDITDLYNEQTGEDKKISVTIGRIMSKADGTPESPDQGIQTFDIYIKLPSFSTRARSTVEIEGKPSSITTGQANGKPLQAQPGQKIIFKHRLTNYGARSNSYVSNVAVVFNDAYKNVWPANKRREVGHSLTSVNRRNVDNGQDFLNTDKNLAANNSYHSLVIRDSDVGKTFCSRIEFTNSGSFRGTSPIIDSYQRYDPNQISYTHWACVKVAQPAQNYQLNVCAKNPNDNRSCGGEIYLSNTEHSDINLEISGPEGVSVNQNTKYIITKFKISPSGETIPIGDKSEKNTENTCSVYNSPPSFNTSISSQIFSDCAKNIQKINDRKIKNTGILISEKRVLSIPETSELGERFCFAISVSPHKLLSSETQEEQDRKISWIHSRPLCALSVRKPSFSVWNNGIYSKNGITTTRTYFHKNNYTYRFGSWVEYEAISNSQISGFSSGSQHSEENPGKGITFSNNSSNLGHAGYLDSGNINNILNQILSKKGEANTSYEEHDNLKIEHNNTLDKSIKTSIIKSKKNIHISGNLYNSKPDQMRIIIANGTVSISKNVKNIDAWIIANKIVTCSEDIGLDKISFVNDNNCSNQLIINGPINTESLKLYRTHGSVSIDSNTSQYGKSVSEIINLRPNAYIWSLNNGSSQPMTTHTKELPVRY